jgi:hypothetical protein
MIVLNPDAQAEEILRSCYVGEMPVDPWVLMVKELISAGLRSAYATGLRRALEIAKDYTSQGVLIQAEIKRDIDKLKAE